MTAVDKVSGLWEIFSSSRLLEYFAVCESEQVDLISLELLTASEFASMGIPFGVRLRIENALCARRALSADAAVGTATAVERRRVLAGCDGSGDGDAACLICTSASADTPICLSADCNGGGEAKRSLCSECAELFIHSETTCLALCCPCCRLPITKSMRQVSRRKARRGRRPRRRAVKLGAASADRRALEDAALEPSAERFSETSAVAAESLEPSECFETSVVAPALIGACAEPLEPEMSVAALGAKSASPESSQSAETSPAPALDAKAASFEPVRLVVCAATVQQAEAARRAEVAPSTLADRRTASRSLRSPPVPPIEFCAAAVVSPVSPSSSLLSLATLSPSPLALPSLAFYFGAALPPFRFAGRVVYVANDKNRFAFLRRVDTLTNGDPDVFLHSTDFPETIDRGDVVAFSYAEFKGRTKAVDVVRMDVAALPTKASVAPLSLGPEYLPCPGYYANVVAAAARFGLAPGYYSVTDHAADTGTTYYVDYATVV